MNGWLEVGGVAPGSSMYGALRLTSLGHGVQGMLAEDDPVSRFPQAELDLLDQAEGHDELLKYYQTTSKACAKVHHNLTVKGSPPENNSEAVHKSQDQGRLSIVRMWPCAICLLAT